MQQHVSMQTQNTRACEGKESASVECLYQSIILSPPISARAGKTKPSLSRSSNIPFIIMQKVPSPRGTWRRYRHIPFYSSLKLAGYNILYPSFRQSSFRFVYRQWALGRASVVLASSKYCLHVWRTILGSRASMHTIDSTRPGFAEPGNLLFTFPASSVCFCRFRLCLFLRNKPPVVNKLGPALHSFLDVRDYVQNLASFSARPSW